MLMGTESIILSVSFSSEPFERNGGTKNYPTETRRISTFSIFFSELLLPLDKQL